MPHVSILDQGRGKGEGHLQCSKCACHWGRLTFVCFVLILSHVLMGIISSILKDKKSHTLYAATNNVLLKSVPGPMMSPQNAKPQLHSNREPGCPMPSHSTPTKRGKSWPGCPT